MKYITYTADDEMPNCGTCDHACDDFECNNSCGPEHGWYGYARTVERSSNETGL